MIFITVHQRNTRRKRNEGGARVKENITGSLTSHTHMLKVYPSCSATRRKHLREQGANRVNELDISGVNTIKTTGLSVQFLAG